jgi:hypothetical protein
VAVPPGPLPIKRLLRPVSARYLPALLRRDFSNYLYRLNDSGDVRRPHVAQSERDIARIYRVRDNIAHGGAFGRRLPFLRYGIRVAHDYLKTLIENLLLHVSKDQRLQMADVCLSAHLSCSAQYSRHSLALTLREPHFRTTPAHSAPRPAESVVLATHVHPTPGGLMQRTVTLLVVSTLLAACADKKTSAIFRR